MATQVKSSLPPILLAIQAWLMTQLGWPPERVLIICRDDVPFDPHGDQYLWIRPRDGRILDNFGDSAGTWDTRQARSIAITLRTRVALDESTQDLILMTDSSRGHLVAEHLIATIVDQFLPMDNSKNVLTDARPMRLRNIERPLKDPRSPDGGIWAQSTLVFDVVFMMDFGAQAILK